MVNDCNIKRPSSCKAFAFLATMLAVGTLVGCGGDIHRVQLSGEVTYKGQPVETGQIRFVPVSGNDAPLTIAKIANGRYDTGKKDGAAVGSYKVMILAFNPNDPIPTGPGSPARRQLLPANYNTQSELTISIKPEEDNKIADFELK